MLELKKYWLVVYNKRTGDFRRAWSEGITADAANELFELIHEEKVIHFGEGKRHPKSYRSLETI